MKKRELQPLWHLEEFRKLLAEAPELSRAVLKKRLLSLLSPQERQRARTLTLSKLLLKVQQSFFADTVPAIPPGSLSEGILTLCQKYSWSLEDVLDLPYPVFIGLLGFDPIKKQPAFTAEDLAAAKARLLR